MVASLKINEKFGSKLLVITHEKVFLQIFLINFPTILSVATTTEFGWATYSECHADHEPYAIAMRSGMVEISEAPDIFHMQ